MPRDKLDRGQETLEKAIEDVLGRLGRPSDPPEVRPLRTGDDLEYPNPPKGAANVEVTFASGGRRTLTLTPDKAHTVATATLPRGEVGPNDRVTRSRLLDAHNNEIEVRPGQRD